MVGWMSAVKLDHDPPPPVPIRRAERISDIAPPSRICRKLQQLAPTRSFDCGPKRAFWSFHSALRFVKCPHKFFSCKVRQHVRRPGVD
jgi:hypothetical protein